MELSQVLVYDKGDESVFYRHAVSAGAHLHPTTPTSPSASKSRHALAMELLREQGDHAGRT